MITHVITATALGGSAAIVGMHGYVLWLEGQNGVALAYGSITALTLIALFLTIAGL